VGSAIRWGKLYASPEQVGKWLEALDAVRDARFAGALRGELEKRSGK
jgi:hypothetical protein